MARYLLGKLVASAVLFVVITLFAFVAFYVLPTSTSVARHGVINPNPVHGSLAGAYAHYFWRVVAHGDLGISTFTREDVTRMLWEAAPVTLSLVGGGLVVALVLALPLGLVSALRPKSLIDRTAGVIVLVGLSLFPLWLALILSYFFGYR